MNVDKINDLLQRQPNLSTALGMEFVSTPEDDTCMAHMTVDERNKQPFGFLSGGATLALAENLAGVGSLAICPGKISVGINVSGNHVKAVQKGRVLHVWHIDIKDSAGDLVSTVQVTNYVITPRQK